jgi:hypothetical protein
MATLNATFHRRLVADAGLALSLTRGQTTFEPIGRPRGAEDPRFDTLHAFAPGYESADIGSVTSGQRIRSSAGYAANGTDNRTVIVNNSALNVVVSAGRVNGAAITTTNVSSSSGVEPFRVVDGADTIARFPNASVIAHGAIVLLCRRTLNGVVEGISVITSTDDGATWQLLFDDPTAQVGVDRLREWAVGGAYVRNFSSDAPLEFFFPMVDYRFKGGTPEATGGVCVLVRATRPNAATGWTFTAARIGEWEDPFPIDHTHSAGMIFLRDAGGTITHARVVVSRGDSMGKSGLSALTIPIASIDNGDWTTLANWTKDDAFHGEADEDLNGVSTRGFQPVGMAPGPDHNTLLMGSDLGMEGVAIVDCTGDKAIVNSTTLLGIRANPGGSEAFAIRCASWHNPPLLGWVARCQPSVSATSPGNFKYAYGPMFFSDDGRTWCETLTGWNFNSTGNTAVMMDVTHLTSLRNNNVDSGATGGGWRPRFTPVKRRALRVGSAALNRRASSVSASALNSASVTLETTPPANLPATCPVYRVTRTPTAVDDFVEVATFTMSSGGFPAGPVAGRVWVYNHGDGSFQFSMSEEIVNGAGDLDSVSSAGGSMALQREWVPLTFSGTRTATGDFVLSLFSQANNALDVSIALDALYASLTMPGYSPASGASAGNERASLDWTDAAADACSAYFAVKLPRDGWDQSFGQVTIPLVSLYQDDNNYAAVEIDMAGENLVLRSVRAGTPSTVNIGKAYPARNMQVVGCLAWNGSTGRLACSASAGGLPLATGELTGLASGFAPDSLRIGWRTAADATTEMLIADAQVIDNAAADDAAAITALKSLSFAQSVPDRLASTITGGTVNGATVRVDVAHTDTPFEVSQALDLTLTVDGDDRTLAAPDSIEYDGDTATLVYTTSPAVANGAVVSVSAGAGAITDYDHDSAAASGVVLTNQTPGGSEPSIAEVLVVAQAALDASNSALAAINALNTRVGGLLESAPSGSGATERFRPAVVALAPTGGYVPGPGAVEHSLIVRDSVTNAPVAGARVWITATESPSASVVLGNLFTDGNGEVRVENGTASGAALLLLPGDYFRHAVKPGTNLINPQPFTVLEEFDV